MRLPESEKRGGMGMILADEEDGGMKDVDMGEFS